MWALHGPAARTVVSPEGEFLSARAERNQRRAQGPRSLKIPFHGVLRTGAAPFGAWNRMDSVPPAAAPWQWSLPSAPDGGAPYLGSDLGRDTERAGLGSAPTKGPESAGEIVQAPLKRGLSPPSGGDWGFLVSCRGRGEGRGKKPSVTASPCHLPFQGRFFEDRRAESSPAPPERLFGDFLAVQKSLRPQSPVS